VWVFILQLRKTVLAYSIQRRRIQTLQKEDAEVEMSQLNVILSSVMQECVITISNRLRLVYQRIGRDVLLQNCEDFLRNLDFLELKKSD